MMTIEVSCLGLLDLENRHRARLAFHDDLAERPKLISARKGLACSLADDNPSPVLLIQAIPVARPG